MGSANPEDRVDGASCIKGDNLLTSKLRELALDQPGRKRQADINLIAMHVPCASENVLDAGNGLVPVLVLVSNRSEGCGKSYVAAGQSP